MLGRIPDSIMLAFMAFCTGGACHDLASIPGQEIYVAMTGGLAILCAITALDCWFGFPALLRLMKIKA